MSLCLKCNKSIDRNAPFCPHCRADVAEQRSHASSLTSPEPHRPRWRIEEKFSACKWIGLLAALLGALLKLIAPSLVAGAGDRLQMAVVLYDIGQYVMVFGLLVLLLSLHHWLKSDT